MKQTKAVEKTIAISRNANYYRGIEPYERSQIKKSMTELFTNACLNELDSFDSDGVSVINFKNKTYLKINREDRRPTYIELNAVLKDRDFDLEFEIESQRKIDEVREKMKELREVRKTTLAEISRRLGDLDSEVTALRVQQENRRVNRKYCR